jgi:peptidyl-prolyl cis-trans isomerase SurA
MKRSIVLAAAAALFSSWALATPATAAPKVALLDRVEAVVDDVPILRSDLRTRERPYLQRLPKDAEARAKTLPQLRKELLEKMIDEVLVAKRAEKLRITVTDAEIDMAMRSVAKNAGVTMQQLESELQLQGMTRAEYVEELRRQIIEGKWLQIEGAPKVDRRAFTTEEAFMQALERKRQELIQELRAKAHVEVRL